MAKEVEDLLSTIRLRPGYDRFLLSQTFESLSRASTHGPVVVLVCTESLCEAIVLPRPHQVAMRVKLPKLSFEHAKYLSQRVKDTNLRARISATRDASHNSFMPEELKTMEVCCIACLYVSSVYVLIDERRRTRGSEKSQVAGC